jgi:hypothetical protein
MIKHIKENIIRNISMANIPEDHKKDRRPSVIERLLNNVWSYGSISEKEFNLAD